MMPRSRGTAWTHRLARVTAITTFLMIVVGGLVTTKDAGDSEPSWSLRFWEWFRSPSELPGGLLYELGHRMIGTVLGFLAIALVVFLWRTDLRKWVRGLGLLMLLGVVSQGALGGFRVRIVSSPWLQNLVLGSSGTGADVANLTKFVAIFHAAMAQAVFCMVVTLAAVTSKSWFQAEPRNRSAAAAGTRGLCLLTMLVVFGQIVLGAYARHTHDRGGILLHAGCALLVVCCVGILVGRVSRRHSDCLPLRQVGRLLTLGLMFQIFLGFGAWATLAKEPGVVPPNDMQVTVRTAHVALGALLLAGSLILTLRSFHLLGPATGGSRETLACGTGQEACG